MHPGETKSDDSSQILHAVQVMFERYGIHASQEAAMRARELSERGDPEGARLWRQVEVELVVRISDKLMLRPTQH